ncbi:MAG: hypothetical protein HC853_09855 [Anaerolineae bacterium]|nr:hypothetical protein [Anaerolineae bacterium]
MVINLIGGAGSSLNADFDGNGIVNGNDFLLWQRGVGLTGQTTNANGDADGEWCG